MPLLTFSLFILKSPISILEMTYCMVDNNNVRACADVDYNTNMGIRALKE